MQKAEAAEQAATEKLAEAADRAKRSLKEYTELQERGASESELAYLWRKVVNHWKKEERPRMSLPRQSKRPYVGRKPSREAWQMPPSPPLAPLSTWTEQQIFD